MGSIRYMTRQNQHRQRFDVRVVGSAQDLPDFRALVENEVPESVAFHMAHSCEECFEGRWTLEARGASRADVVGEIRERFAVVLLVELVAPGRIYVPARGLLTRLCGCESASKVCDEVGNVDADELEAD